MEHFEDLVKELFISRKGVDEKHWESLWNNYKNSAIVKDLKFIYDKIICETTNCNELAKFYLDNKDDPVRFVIKHPEYKERINKMFGKDWQEKLANPFLKYKLILAFNNWLFMMIFKDFLKGEDVNAGSRCKNGSRQ